MVFITSRKGKILDPSAIDRTLPLGFSYTPDFSDPALVTSKMSQVNEASETDN